MQITFDEAVIQSLICPPERDYMEYTDSSKKGLILRINNGGQITWALRIRTTEGKKQRKINMYSAYDGNKFKPLKKVWEDAQKFMYQYSIGKTPLDPVKRKGVTMNSIYAAYSQKNGALDSHYKTATSASIARYNIEAILDVFGTGNTIEATKFDKWRAMEITNGKSAATLNKHLSAYNVMMSWAVKQKLIESNPLKEVERLPEGTSCVGRALTDEEWKNIITVISNPPYRGTYWLPAIVMADETGLRQGTEFGLTWDDLDFDKSLIRLRPEIMKVKGRGIEWAAMSPYLKETLQQWKFHAPDVSKTALVFGVLAPPQKIWKRIKAAAKIENFRWHDFRHDLASRAVSDGISDRAVAAMLHQGSTDLVKRYGHLRPDAAQRNVEVISRGKTRN